MESLEGLEHQDALHTLAVRVRPLLRSRALLSQLPALTSLSVAGRRVYGGRDADGIWRRAPDGTLGTLLPPLPSLETLRVTGTFLCSLDGLEHLPGLQALVIAGCRGIRVWDALRQAPASLTLLDCRDCEPYGYVRGQGASGPTRECPPALGFVAIEADLVHRSRAALVGDGPTPSKNVPRKGEGFRCVSGRVGEPRS